MLKGKVALVTGASRGIGRAVAFELVRQGAQVAVSARNGELLDALVAEIIAAGGEAMGVAGDIGLAADADRLVEQAVNKFGRADILVNNAGITRDGLLLRMKDEDWDAVLETNLKGAFLCTRAVARVMTRQKSGRIINISSVVGEMGNAGQVNYCASKAGLIGLTKATARELARRSITVNAVAPGFIATDMTEGLSDKARQDLIGQIPLGRLGVVDDVAASVAFLASDQAAYITGQVLGVNGGMYM
ncbi:MAG TPA: 3-oxoacyl-[acyl-carrier-protein] reductase [Desulfuromonadales bacterium]|nr:3-oxoacyl-[acyl-carrier-protein] reductase [Desulfuromonadales bacterium]